MEQRKLEEIEFHNRREQDRLAARDEEEFIKQYPNKRFYAINRGPREATRQWLEEHCPGAVALDYCCGLGATSLELARLGATVHGIDISTEELKTAEKTLAEAGYGDRAEFHAMDAENMEFPDDMFDVIVCSGVLHHLDLEHAYPELARVLKPTGQIICIEAQGANPLINLYRKRTPKLRTSWEAEHILTVAQVKQAKPFFEHIDMRFFHLLTILAVPFRKAPFFEALLGALEALDRVILKIPGVQRMAWQMMFFLSAPKKGTASEPREKRSA